MKKTMIAMLLAGIAAFPLTATVLKDDVFTKNARGWLPLSSNAGKLERVEQNGEFVLKLDPVDRNGTMVAKFYTNNSRQIKFLPGDTFVMKVTAKGKGKMICGVLSYGYKSGSPDYNPTEPQELSGDYKTYEFRVTINKQFRMILPYIELKDSSDVFVSKFHMETVADEKVSVELKTPMQVSSLSEKAQPVKFLTSVKDGNVAISLKMDKEIETRIVTTNSEGNISLPADNLKEGFWEISASAAGKAATGYIDVQTEDIYRATDAAAKEINLEKPVHILFLGDSLTDFDRGYNYISRINFWANKYNPGKFTYRNAGVGGDFCQRMVDRLQGELRGKNWAWRQDMYKDLFKEKYDIIFLFLGQNDTRSFRKSDFKTPTTPPDLQKKCLNEIYDILTQNAPGAKIVLVSPSPSYKEIMIKHSLRDLKNPNTVIYGLDELVDAYDKVNQEFCKEKGLSYIDITGPMREMPSRKDLYGPDGIHLNQLGGRVIADQFLKFLAKEY